MYHSLESIKDMHVEITNRCNAACPMCARNHFGGATKKDLRLDEWSTEDVRRIFDPRLKNLENVMFCGTHGDPVVADNSLIAINHIKHSTDATVEFYSNASLRKPTWWRELGSLMSTKKPDHWHYNKHDLAIFSIDGLEDTNHLYRRKTNFKNIIKNAEAFIEAGGFARWDFIVFKHNQHQVEEAKKLADEMGFKEFRIRKTARFTYSPDGPMKWRVQDKHKNIEYYLQPPTDKNYYNAEQDKWTEITKTDEGKNDYLNNTKISCLYKNKFRRIYVNAYADVFPCCYISNDVYPGKNSIVKDSQQKIFDRYQKHFNSLRHHSWDDILEHEWFANEIENSWNTNLEGGRLMRCARTCGAGFKPITTQSHTQKINSVSTVS